MELIRIRNLRSLADTADVELKPLTLLVGANSSGKSSFLRVFPMLRQSAETRTGSGLLLNEPYVDYGQFPIALRQHADPPEIILDLTVTLGPRDYGGASRFSFFLEPVPIRIGIHFSRKSQAELYSYVRQVDLTLGSGEWKDQIVLEAEEDGRLTSLKINDYNAQIEAGRLRLKAGRGIVPQLVPISSEDADSAFVADDPSRASAFTATLLRETDSTFHGRTLRNTRIDIFRAVRIGSPSGMLMHMRKITDNGVWNMRMRAWDAEYPAYRKLRTLILGDRLPDILSALGVDVTEFSRAVHYFEPVRARVQRDYVSRDVQVESVEPDGKNVAMFLTSLPGPLRNSFQDWLAKNFALSVYPKEVGDGARIALRLKEEKSGAEFNLADMGFGYSQMLPLLVQIWALLERDNLRRASRRYYYQLGWRTEVPRHGYLVSCQISIVHKCGRRFNLLHAQKRTSRRSHRTQ